MIAAASGELKGGPHPLVHPPQDPSDDPGADSRTQKVRILSAFLVTLYGVIPVLLTGVLAVDIAKDLNFGVAELGAAVSAGFAASAVTSSPTGHLVHRLGGAASMRIAAILSALSLAGIGLATRRWGELVVFLVLGGIANAMAQPAAHQVLATDVASRNQGIAFGIKDAAKPFATFVGGVSVPIVALTIGWRAVFIMSGIAAAVTGFFLRVSRGESPAVEHEQNWPLRLPRLIVLAIGVALASAGTNAMVAFFIISAVAGGMAHDVAGILVSVGSILAVAMRVVAGRVADRRSGVSLRSVTVMLVVGAAAMFLVGFAHGWLLIVGSCIAFAAALGWLGAFNFAVVSMHRGLAAKATGITGTGSFLGATLGPAGFGVVAATVSFRVAWLFAACLLVVAAVVFEGVYALQR